MAINFYSDVHLNANKLGRDADNLLDFSTDNEITFRVGAGDGVVFKASGEIEATSLDIGTGGVDVNGNVTLAGFVLDGNTITGVDDSGEFTDDDNHIMTSAGINDKFSVIAGSASITTVGTIGTGTWQGPAIAYAQLDAATAHLTTDQTFTGVKQINKRKFTVTGTTHQETQGDVVYLGSGSTVAGELCYFTSSGTWVAADADATGTSGGVLLALALGTDPDADGMLLRGMFTLDHDPGTIADELYVSTTAGDITGTAPSGSGDIVRVVGYCLDSTNGQIWFNPSNDFIVLA